MGILFQDQFEVKEVGKKFDKGAQRHSARTHHHTTRAGETTKWEPRAAAS